MILIMANIVCYILQGIGMIFILCESRSSNMYTAIWKKIIELVPMLQQNLKFIMSDYEMAATHEGVK